MLVNQCSLVATRFAKELLMIKEYCWKHCFLSCLQFYWLKRLHEIKYWLYTKPTSFLLPENTKDLGLLLLRSRVWVTCAVVRTWLFYVLPCLLQRWGPAPRQHWWVDVCQGEVYKPVSPTHCSTVPFTANQSQQPVGMYQDCEAKDPQCFQRSHTAQQGPSFLCLCYTPWQHSPVSPATPWCLQRSQSLLCCGSVVGTCGDVGLLH